MYGASLKDEILEVFLVSKCAVRFAQEGKFYIKDSNTEVPTFQ